MSDRRRGLDERQRAIITGLVDVRVERLALDRRERKLVRDGLSLGVPITWMSETLGLARNTLTARAAKAARGKADR